MVHLRLNEREANPNPHINFISALHSHSQADHDSAKQLLLALAAQVRPVMKDHGFAVNSLEEYEHNKVFLGRNWNAGETIELVLRGPDGSFMPTHFIMSTLCHELAHIKHMNHGPAFQELWRRLRTEVRALQDRGYFGDGYWSSGTRLGDSAQVEGKGVASSEYMPEYMCGGAQNRQRPTAIRRRRGARRPRETVPSLLTGRQTAKRRKAGARVTSKYAFEGEGTTLSGQDPKAGGKGAGFRKQATSKTAREERLAAIEKRMQTLQGNVASTSTTNSAETAETIEIDSSDDEDDAYIEETDSERRQRLREAEGENEITSWDDFADDFVFGTSSSSTNPAPGPSSNSGVKYSSPSSTPGASSSSKPEPSAREPARPRKPGLASKADNGRTPASIGLGKLVQSEIALRKKESVGLAPVKNEETRKLGGRPQLLPKAAPSSRDESAPRCDTMQSSARDVSKPAGWSCLACTFINEPSHLACSICATPKGDSHAC